MTTETGAVHRMESTHVLRGLGGIVGVESRVWFPWRVLFLVIAGVGVFALIYVPWRTAEVNQLGPLLLSFFALWIAMLLVSVVSLTEGSVLGEIERGTASWLVGMPIARPAVVIGKFVAASAGVTATVFATGAAIYPVLANASQQEIADFPVSELFETTGAPIGRWGSFIPLPDLGTYLITLAGLSVLLIFVVATMSFLGTTLRSRTAVFGLGLAVIGIFGAASFAPSLSMGSPAALIAAIVDVAQDEEAAFVVPMAATAFWTGAMMLLAVWRFNRRELP